MPATQPMSFSSWARRIVLPFDPQKKLGRIAKDGPVCPQFSNDLLQSETGDSKNRQNEWSLERKQPPGGAKQRDKREGQAKGEGGPMQWRARIDQEERAGSHVIWYVAGFGKNCSFES